MRTTHVVTAALLALMALGASGQGKNCDELKSEIAAKIDANGVPVYTLSIVDADAAHDGKVVGSCGGNTKRIVYVRGAVAPAPLPAATEAPQPEASPMPELPAAE